MSSVSPLRQMCRSAQDDKEESGRFAPRKELQPAEGRFRFHEAASLNEECTL